MRLAITILLFFTIAQILGLFTSFAILSDIDKNPYVASMVFPGDSADPISAIFVFAYILLGAGVMVLLIRFFKKQGNFFKLIEFFLIASSSSIVFYSILRLLFGFGYDLATTGGILSGLLLSVLRARFPVLKNVGSIFSAAGAGVIMGISLQLVPAVLFLVLLALYDYVAVFKTKHMVELAEFVVKQDLSFTVTATNPKHAPNEKARLDLGTGDLMAPIMLEIAALTFKPVASLFVLAGAIVSMGIFLYFVSKKKLVLPAIPPIALGMLLSLGIGFLLGFY
ncbi:hypothetical protein HZC07_05435 [Candidatus Micrarchaeota archaeon]|nr:hypothetical protein [Candidatus Micrarchaeota archaeon]